MSGICTNCGSNKVQGRLWIDINTQKIYWEISELEDSDTWCHQCEGNRGICSQDEYIKLKRAV